MATKTITATANTTPTKLLSAVAISVIAGLLGYFGYVHFADGMALDAAVPVPVYMVAQVAMPKSAYAAAADALAKTNPRNGRGLLLWSEARLHAGVPSEKLASTFADGVSRMPASSRGWTLLAEMQMPRDPGSAAKAIGQAMALAPRDSWLIGGQVQDAAQLWPQLDQDSQEVAILRARLLWTDPTLRMQIKSVVQTPQGAALMTRALSDGERRALNRWLVQQAQEARAP